MPVPASHVGREYQPYEQTVDARWMMAYAAGLDDLRDDYLDTEAGIVAHPMFPVAVEWEPILHQRFEPDFPGELTIEERGYGVHSAHDLHIHRPIRPADKLTTQMSIVGVYARKPGAFLISKLTTVDDAGDPVCTTWMQNLFRGVALSGEETWSETLPAPPDFKNADAIDDRHEIPVSANQAHVYTECARIHAPIHTDVAVANAVGLPGLILHGTCTLALAVSKVVNEYNVNPSRVLRIGCRFSGMVPMPSTLTLAVRQSHPEGVSFEVDTEQGHAALSQAYVCWSGE